MGAGQRGGARQCPPVRHPASHASLLGVALACCPQVVFKPLVPGGWAQLGQAEPADMTYARMASWECDEQPLRPGTDTDEGLAGYAPQVRRAWICSVRARGCGGCGVHAACGASVCVRDSARPGPPGTRPTASQHTFASQAAGAGPPPSDVRGGPAYPQVLVVDVMIKRDLSYYVLAFLVPLVLLGYMVRAPRRPAQATPSLMRRASHLAA